MRSDFLINIFSPLFSVRNETLLHTAESSNVQDDETDLKQLNCNIKDAVITQTIYSNRSLSQEEEILEEQESVNLELKNFEYDELKEDALAYLGGSLIKHRSAETTADLDLGG